MRYVWDGQRVQNNLYFYSPAFWNVSKATALSEYIVQAWSTYARPSVASTCSLASIYCTDLTTENSFTYEHVTGLPLAGTQGTASMPNNCTIAVSYVTALRGRSFRGRSYLVGLTEGNVTGNTVASAFVDAWVDFLEDLDNGVLIDLTAYQVVVSRIEQGNPRPSGIASQVLTRVARDYVVDTQRGRLPGRGQ